MICPRSSISESTFPETEEKIMWKCRLAVLFVVAVRPGLGQDVTTGASPPCPYKPYASTAPQSDYPSPEMLFSKADHIRIAAEHLEAAGLKDEAKRVRQKEAEGQAHPTQLFLTTIACWSFRGPGSVS